MVFPKEALHLKCPPCHKSSAEPLKQKSNNCMRMVFQEKKGTETKKKKEDEEIRKKGESSHKSHGQVRYK